MLGHKLYQHLTERFNVFGTVRTDFDALRRFGIFDEQSILTRVDVADDESIRRAIETVRPDCVINAIGIIKQIGAANDAVLTLRTNSCFPRRLAELSNIHGFRFITVSTDCVFSGDRGMYSEDDVPDARDLYGMSKLLGEVADERSLTIRTSIIGRELSSRHSIVEWFLSRRGGSVDGYANAIYTGFSAAVLADIIATIIVDHPTLNGIYHVSSESISKFDLLHLLNRSYHADVTIRRRGDVVIDRSLDSSRFRRVTGHQPPLWSDMIEQMADDHTPYDRWKN
jgi:dTDP-4-dehydrorhamnose reductase